MLSRVADSIYWMARYIERAENIARFIDVNNHLLLDSEVPVQSQWDALLAVMADEERYFERYETANEDDVVHFLVFDRENPNSLLSCLRAARENARAIREIISGEMWLHLNTLYHLVRGAAEIGTQAANEELFNRVRVGSHLFSGLTTDTMTHGEAYRFAQLGRLIERADKTSRIIDVKYFLLLPQYASFGSPFDSSQWMAVLKSVSAYEMYWKKMARIEPFSVIGFLLKDPEFPRSVQFCVCHAADVLAQIVAITNQTEDLAPLCRLRALAREIETRPMDEIVQIGVHETIDHIQRQLNDWHGELQQAFF